MGEKGEKDLLCSVTKKDDTFLTPVFSQTKLTHFFSSETDSEGFLFYAFYFGGILLRGIWGENSPFSLP